MLPLVDRRGHSLNYCAMSGAAHRLGLVHRTADVIITSADAAILLRQRRRDDVMFPKQFSLSAGGHCRAGEHPRQTARRELAEELGLWISDLRRFVPIHGSPYGIPLVYREWESTDRSVKSWQFDLDGPVYCRRTNAAHVKSTRMKWPAGWEMWRSALGHPAQGSMRLKLLNQEVTFYYLVHMTQNEVASALVQAGEPEQFTCLSIADFQSVAGDPFLATDSLWSLRNHHIVERLSRIIADTSGCCASASAPQCVTLSGERY